MTHSLRLLLAPNRHDKNHLLNEWLIKNLKEESKPPIVDAVYGAICFHVRCLQT